MATRASWKVWKDDASVFDFGSSEVQPAASAAHDAQVMTVRNLECASMSKYDAKKSPRERALGVEAKI